MKKILTTIFFLLLLVKAQDFEIVQGWQLVGATVDMNSTIFNDTCVSKLVGYDGVSGEWSIYISDTTNATGSSSVATLSLLERGKGYWIYGQGICTVRSQ